jgi:diguanylate cyclase (GGDEF)-like protein
MGAGEERPAANLAATISPETTLHGVVLPERSGQQRTGSLVVIAGAAADVGTHVVVSDEVIIGRVGAGLVLRDGRISRQHARVWREGSRWLAEDLASRNGSSLNGRALERPTPLGDGDKIYLGSTVVKFTLVDETEAAYLEQMARLAGTDPLTGLHAKHRFDSMLDEALRTARLTETPLAVLMMDMDGLKKINDTWGHRFGANTIATIGAAIGQLLAGRGEACRYGGDEFCAYLPNVRPDEARAVAEEIRATVEAARPQLDGIEVRATISIGLASRGTESTTADLVAAADAALYRAKAAGRNRVSE